MSGLVCSDDRLVQGRMQHTNALLCTKNTFVTNDGSATDEENARVPKAGTASTRLHQLWGQKRISKDAHIKSHYGLYCFRAGSLSNFGRRICDISRSLTTNISRVQLRSAGTR
ncbi:hypothetical protein T265_00989 [Opisthorchis viverrini]|uniref:Uncharacterized protein n=1 Tax=Opisthorchis viverrini TaxID=6198 RepID=A0A075A056_OPIVI|nr:hypothetical protein T265_00989 [Opisthorchis viverrini]KER33093.1 hypothetical protein T265_00989 [Opisthorchis viverrini]